MEETGVYNLHGLYYRLKKAAAESIGLKEVSGTELRDISYLVADEYLSFFLDPNAECLVPSAKSPGKWEYSEIMQAFKQKVLTAYSAMVALDDSLSRKSVWAKMRDKYFNGKDYVYPDEMICYIDSFDNSEIVAFLHYCAEYKERFCDGAYCEYVKDGYFGKLLLKLKERPLSFSF